MKNILKHPIVSTVIAGLILWLLAWVGGFMPGAWAWVKQTALAVWSIVTYKLSLPLWSVILISIPLTACLVRMSRSRSAVVPNSYTELGDVSGASEKLEIKLTEDEVKVMRLLVQADGESLQVRYIKRRLNFPALKIEQIFEVLEEKQLIDIHSNPMHGTSFRLTRFGRDHMIGNDYANT